MEEFKKYRKTQIAEMRPVTGDEARYGIDPNISISPADKENGSPFVGDMIARNPKNHNDQWLVAKKFFNDNYELIIDSQPPD